MGERKGEQVEYFRMYVILMVDFFVLLIELDGLI